MDLTSFESIRTKLGLAHAGKPALVGLAALLVMVAVFAGRMIIDTATATDIQLQRDDAAVEEPQASGEHGGAQQTAGQSDVAASSASSAPETVPADVYVHVSGAVAKPGLVKLVEGDRIADAVEAAGGATEEARLESVNLAQKVEDGQHVHVAGEGDVFAHAEDAAAAMQRSAGETTGLVNINTASAEELQALPGIGPSTAQKIVAERQSGGPFDSKEDIQRVSGIGEKKYGSISDLICV